VPSTLETLIDLTTSHRIGIERFTTGTIQKIARLLERADADIDIRVREMLSRRRSTEFESSTMVRMQALSKRIKDLLGEAYSALLKVWRTDLTELAGHESAWAAQTYEKVLRLNHPLHEPSPQLLESIVTGPACLLTGRGFGVPLSAGCQQPRVHPPE
jgi:hypothetical protein